MLTPCLRAAAALAATGLASLLAQEAGNPGTEVSILSMIESSSWIGVLIILASVLCVAFAIEQFLGLRREARIVGTIRQRLIGARLEGREAEVVTWCKGNPSLVGALLIAGLGTADEHREKAVQDEAADYAGRLYRKAEYLLFIGNIAPMLGLLGTVVGMMQSFNVIASRGGSADPGELADGISKALVTTCMGLLVALPALVVYTTTRNKIDALLAEVGKVVDRILFPDRQNPAVVALVDDAA